MYGTGDDWGTHLPSLPFFRECNVGSYAWRRNRIADCLLEHTRDPLLVDIFRQMTTIRPENRPSATALLTHAYCAEVAQACELQMAEELLRGLPEGAG